MLIGMVDMVEYNPYFRPEEMGLKQVAILSGYADDYGYNELVVWGELKSNKLYWAADFGCSCPTPFEQFNSIDKLHPLNSKRDYDEFEVEVMGFDRQNDVVTMTARMDVLRKVRKIIGLR